MFVEFFEWGDVWGTIGGIIGAEEVNLEGRDGGDEERRAAAAGTDVEFVTRIWNAFHAEYVVAGTLAADWFDADFVTDGAFVLIAL